MGISRELLEILACPKCKGAVRLRADSEAILCDACKLSYPVRDEIPVMLLDEAEPLR